MADDLPDEILKNRDPSKAIPPLYGALIKNEQDVQLLERLAFMTRRESNNQMLINLFNTLKDTGVPCTLRELLDLLTALDKRLVFANTDEFYFLSRAILVKDEKNYDKFDRAFDIYFKGLETLDDVIQALICLLYTSPSPRDLP